MLQRGCCDWHGHTEPGGAASHCARTRGEPSSAHCEQRLSERLTPCPCEPVCACTGMRGHAEKAVKGNPESRQKAGKTMQPRSQSPCISARAPTRSAAGRAGMAGWAWEGGGRFGERREYEAPTLPSTPRQHGTARHQTRQPRNGSPPQQSGKKRHPPKHTSRETPHHHPSKPINPGDSRKTRLVKMRIAGDGWGGGCVGVFRVKMHGATQRLVSIHRKVVSNECQVPTL